jgi:hypothetical protein
LNDTRVSRLVEYQLKMTNVQGDQASEKWRKNVENILKLKTVAEQTNSSQTPLGSDMEFARRF